MKRILLLLLILPFVVNGQSSHEMVTLRNGWRIKPGDTVHVGKGSMSKGFFKYVWYAPKQPIFVSDSLEQKKLYVDNIYYTPFYHIPRLNLSDESGRHYVCAPEAALKLRELVPPKGYWNYNKFPNGPLMSYSGVIQVTSTREVTIDKLVAWFKNQYSDTVARINKINKEKGIFSLVSSFRYKSPVAFGNFSIKGTICYTLNASIKDGILKYEFTDFIHQPDTANKGGFEFGFLSMEEHCPNDRLDKERGRKWSNRIWMDMKYKSDSLMKIVIPQFKSAMK